MTARRDFLAFTAGVVAVGTVARAASSPQVENLIPCPDADLLRLRPLLDAAAAVEAQVWANAGPEDVPPGLEEAHGRITDILDQIEATPAATLDGIYVKIRAFQWCREDRPITGADVLPYYSGERPATDERLMVSLLADLEAMRKVRDAMAMMEAAGP